MPNQYISLNDPFRKLNYLFMGMVFCEMMFISCFIGTSLETINLFTSCNNNVVADITDINRIDYNLCNFSLQYVSPDNQTYTNNILNPCSICIGENCDKLTICYQYFNPNAIGAFNPERETFQQSLSHILAYVALLLFTFSLTSFTSNWIRKEFQRLSNNQDEEN